MLKSALSTFSKVPSLASYNVALPSYYQAISTFSTIQSKIHVVDETSHGRNVARRRRVSNLIEFFQRKKKKKVEMRVTEEKNTKNFKHNIYHLPHILEQ